MRRKTKLITITTGASSIALGFLLLGGTSFAETTTTITANVTEGMALAVEAGDVEFNIDPAGGGGFGQDSLVVSVSTNAPGYSLFLNDSDQDTSLANIDPEKTAKFTALTEDVDVTTSSFPANSWGYSLDQNIWHGVTVLPTRIKQVDERIESGTDTTNIHFGAKANLSIPAGVYKGSVTLTAIGKVEPGMPKPDTPTIFDLTTMQGMSSAICAATPTPTVDAVDPANSWSEISRYVNTENISTLVPEATLKDVRDGKEYLVRKLADGNCWMSQNLEFDILGEGDTYYTGKTSIPSGTSYQSKLNSSNYFGGTVKDNANDTTFKLTSEDTDIHSTTVWTPKYFKDTYVDTGKAPYAKVYRTTIGIRTEADHEYEWFGNGFDGLRSYNIAASNPDLAYGIDTGEWDGVNKNFISGSSGLPSERRGNFYNWTAATLGSNLVLSETGDVAQDSICPRGWQLPNYMDNKSFYYLLQEVYNVPRNSSSAGIELNNKVNIFPLSFNRSGYYSYTGGYPVGIIRSIKFFTNYLYSVRYSNLTDSDNISAGAGSADRNSSYGDSNASSGNGFTIRCVAR